MAKNRLKLFRLTKQGLMLVKKALMGYDSINDFYIKNKKFVHRDTFTKFHNGDRLWHQPNWDALDRLVLPRTNWYFLSQALIQKVQPFQSS